MTSQIQPSRLMLGTVQFGLSYGVANTAGAPAFSEICAMLEEAAAAGINCLDTAAAYGESEEVLGRALTETGLKDAFYLASKTVPLPAGLSSQEITQKVRESVERSLQRLQVEWLPLVLLHRDDDLSQMDALALCQQAGLIGRCGVSVGDPGRAKPFLDHPAFGAIQVPANVLDRRFTHGGVTGPAKQRGALVFARSCYLQGLFLMDDENTPPHLHVVIPARNFFRQLAAEYGLPLSHLLAKSMMERADIDAVVMGMETRAQLRQNVELLKRPDLDTDLMRRIEAFQPQIPAWLIDPPSWPSHALSPAASSK